MDNENKDILEFLEELMERSKELTGKLTGTAEGKVSYETYNLARSIEFSLRCRIYDIQCDRLVDQNKKYR